MKGLTPKQSKILHFIQSFITEKHYSPSYREIMQHFGFTSPATVYRYIHCLIDKGVLNADKQTYRSLLPIQSSQESLQDSQTIQLSLIGNLFIGYPLELFIHPRSIGVPAHLIHETEHTYILQTQGDSLQSEGIHDGDLLLIEARPDIQPGEMILALINQHESILKRYYPEGQYIRLESEHPHHPPLTVRSEHLSIQGVLVGLLRTY